MGAGGPCHCAALGDLADYNADWYASRNAALQNAVALASGSTLALDGDLLDPGAPLDEPGQTGRALRRLAPQLGMDGCTIRRALEQGDRLQCSDSALHVRAFALAEASAGKPLPDGQPWRLSSWEGGAPGRASR